MDVFALRDQLVDDYRHYAESFLTIKDERIREHVERELDEGLLWPDPALQLNPAFEPGGYIDELVGEGVLHAECGRIFRVGKRAEAGSTGEPLRLHRHQAEAIRRRATGENYVLTTGTGSGKSLAYIVPIVDHVLRDAARRRRADQGDRRLPDERAGQQPGGGAAEVPQPRLSRTAAGPVTFRRYTGQENDEQREEIRSHPPDILLTNYVMLEFILTRPYEQALVRAAEGLSFLVLDELHTYRGRQGADVALLVRRVRDALQGHEPAAASARRRRWRARARSPSSGPRSRGSRAACSARRSSRRASSARRCARRPPTSTSTTPTSAPRLTERVRAGAAAGDLRGDDRRSARVLDRANARDRLRTRPTGATSAACRGRLRGEDGAARAAGRGDRAVGRTVCLRGAAGGAARRQQDHAVRTASRSSRSACTSSSAAAARSTVSLAPEAERYISTTGQQYVPGDREQLLMPLAFCRECGQEYFPVRLRETDEGDGSPSRGRSPTAAPARASATATSTSRATNPWPSATRRAARAAAGRLARAGDGRRQAQSLPRTAPAPITRHDRTASVAPTRPARPLRPGAVPLLPELRRRVRRRADRRLRQAQLRSAPAGAARRRPILGLSAVRQLRADDELPPEARKLLSFSDNRQDASLQAGHFNDFVEIGLLRSALHRGRRAARATRA